MKDEGTGCCERHRQASGKAPDFRAQENFLPCGDSSAAAPRGEATCHRRVL